MNVKHSVLGVIAARGGSKGLLRKNVLDAGGKPLISWTIGAAQNSTSITKLILSSDDEEIIQTALSWGCEVPFVRPSELAYDSSSSIDVVLHALDEMPGFDYVMLLQPTSPLRTAEDIDDAFSLLQLNGSNSCVSVCEAEQSPYWMYELNEDKILNPVIAQKLQLTRRQDLPPVYMLNGAIYIANVEWLRSTKNFLAEGCIGYIMSKRKSLDIDTAEDLAIFNDIAESLK
jgi:CMP-N,N'-diacetyllegionaminic acid synthase